MASLCMLHHEITCAYWESCAYKKNKLLVNMVAKIGYEGFSLKLT